MDLYARMLADPARLAALSTNLMVDYMRLWQASWMRMMGVESLPIAERSRATTASRTRTEHELPVRLHQAVLLITARHMQQHAVADAEGLSPESEKKVASSRASMDALAPSTSP
jgi:hypothetical protein